MQNPLNYGQDLRFVGQVLAGDEKAAADLRAKHQSKLVGILRARGASTTEAEDLVADFWSDCFGANHGECSILSRYRGLCALESWLTTILSHRLVDLKRRQRFCGDLPGSANATATDAFDRLPGAASVETESTLLNLLHAVIANAFARCDREELLLLNLVHVHQVSQRELARMWGWHESKMSRLLQSAREKIKKFTLLELRRIDPWVELNWQDFLELCQCSSDSFTESILTNTAQNSEVQKSNIRAPGAIVSS